MVDQPLVSIVIVNYNSGHYLPQCLRSIQEQNYPNWELIIIDNDSKDASVSYLVGKNWIKLVKNNVNTGFAGGQNKGFHLAKGKYLLALKF